MSVCRCPGVDWIRRGGRGGGRQEWRRGRQQPLAQREKKEFQTRKPRDEEGDEEDKKEEKEEKLEEGTITRKTERRKKRQKEKRVTIPSCCLSRIF